MSRSFITKIVIGVFLVLGVIVGIYAVGQVTLNLSRAHDYAGKPVNVQTRVLSSDQVVISWTTEKEVISLVLYGNSPASLVQTQTELSSTRIHRVTLSDLIPGRNYYFQIQVGQEIYDDNGQPWFFSTPKLDSSGEMTEEDLRNAYGTTDVRYDLNKDGIVNGFDLQLFFGK